MMAGIRATSEAGKPRPFKLANILHWSWQEWAAILTIAGFFLCLKFLGAPSAAETLQLRAQFRLPDDVALTKVYLGRSEAKPFPADIEGYVQFSDTQFRQYVAKLDDASVWRPVPIALGGSEFHGAYASDALAWRDLRGARQLGWGSLSRQQAQDARNGRVFCLTLRDVAGAGDRTSYRGEQCQWPGSPGVRAIHVQGLLDFDTRTLHMLIRHQRPTNERRSTS